MLQKISRGDVYFYNFGFDYDGSVEGKNRPCVIVSNDKGNMFGTTALVAPITTRSKDSCKPWQVHFQNGNKSQIILCEQIKTVNVNKLYNYQGHLDELTMKAVDEALAIEFDLNVTQKELDSVEFLHRLDNTLYKVVNNRLATYDKKINETLTNTIQNITKCEVLCQNIMNALTEFSFNKDNITIDVSEIKEMISNNVKNISNVLMSLSDKYDEIYVESSNVAIDNKNKTITQITSVDNTVSKNETKQIKYTVEDAKTMVYDYYSIDRKSFMIKYSLKDSNAVNNKMTCMRNILKRAGINYNGIKCNALYNGKKEKQLFKKADIKTSTDIAINIEKSNSKTPKRNSKWQPAINYENVQELLAFIDECNQNSTQTICDKYGLTKKQLSNRKYLITKSLKDRNIPYTNNMKGRKK